MDDKTEYELGARQPVARRWPDPSDEFSQEAAKNEKPKSGQGLSERPRIKRDLKTPASEEPENAGEKPTRDR